MKTSVLCLAFAWLPAAYAQESNPSSGPASAPASTSTTASAPTSQEGSSEELLDKYAPLISAFSGGGIFQLQPQDDTLVAPLGGEVFSDVVGIVSGSERDIRVGVGFHGGGKLAINFEKQVSLDAYVGVGPGLQLGRIVLGVFGGGGVDGVGVFVEEADQFKLPTAVYGYAQGRANVVLTQRVVAEAAVSLLARSGDIDELRLTGRLVRLNEDADTSSTQEGSSFGFSYTDYDGAAETFSILWGFAVR